MRDSSRHYQVSVKAGADLEAIWLYTLEKWSPEQANDYYNQLVECFQPLANGTKRGRKIDGIPARYRVFPCQSHYIVYAENDRAVTIIRILHKRMNIALYL